MLVPSPDHLQAKPKRQSQRYGSILVALLVAAGPGILAMAGDNDAGGLLSYAATGAKFGAPFFLPALGLLGILTFTIQETALRLGRATGCGLPVLLGRRMGGPWAKMIAVELAVQNIATLVSEFAGMAIGLSHFGLSVSAAAGMSLALVGTVLATGNIRVAERIGLVLAGFNVTLLYLAFRVHPSVPWPHILWPNTHIGFALYAAALAGNALAPWMPFFQCRASADRRLSTRLGAARADLLLGTCLQIAVAAATLLLAATTAMGTLHPIAWLATLDHTFPGAGDLAALGLFDAGFVACLTVSLTSTWTVAEAWRGNDRSTPTRPRDNPGFYGLFGGGLLVAAAAVAIPGSPLVLLAIAAQAISALFLPPLVGAIVWMGARPEMGRLRSGRASVLGGILALTVFVVAGLCLLSDFS